MEAVADAVPSQNGGVSASRSSDRRKDFIAAAAVLLVLLVAIWPSFDHNGGPMDEGMILIYPEMMMRGKLPYRDFETFYGPANPALLASVFSVFGTNIFAERAVGLLYRLLILGALFALVKHWGRTLAVGCVFLSGCLLLQTYLPAFAWFGAVACVLWSLWAIRRVDSARRCLVGGILAGCALLFRVDVGPAIVLSALPLLHLMDWPRRLRYLLGGAIALLPLAVLALVAGPWATLENLFLMPVIHSSPGRHLPLLSQDPFLVQMFFAHVVAVLINIAAGVAAIRQQPRDAWPRLLLGLALIGLGLTHQAAQRLDITHLLFTAFVSIGILPLSVVVLTSWFRGVAPRRSEMLAALLAVVVTLQVISPGWGKATRDAFIAGLQPKEGSTFVEHHGRSFPFQYTAKAELIGKLLDTIERSSRPGERLFVGPADLRRTNYADTYLYHMLPKLVPATYFLEMNPFSANRPGSRLAADVASADWLVLNRSLDTWKEPNRSREFGSDEPNVIVRENFEVQGEFGPYLVLRKKRLESQPAS